MKIFALDEMNVPGQRKILTDHNIRWLIRNLGIRNSQHPKYKETIQLLKNLIKKSN